jgi:hypothetical protein
MEYEEGYLFFCKGELEQLIKIDGKDPQTYCFNSYKGRTMTKIAYARSIRTGKQVKHWMIDMPLRATPEEIVKWRKANGC